MGRWQRPWLAAAMAVLATAGVLAVSGAAQAGPATATSGWGKAITLPAQAGAPAAISCSSPGNCGAASSYAGGFVYVDNQIGGIWRGPKVIPGTARTSKPASGAAGIACFSAGGCVVVGSYLDLFGHHQAFIATQTRGVWGKLRWVPGLAKLDKGNNAGIGQLSCPSAGNCTAVGSYTDAKGTGRSFVVSQSRGVWGSAIAVPHLGGLPGQRPGTIPGFGPIACSSAGNCAAGGTYVVGTRGAQDSGNQSYVDEEVNGVWGTPVPVPGLAALNTGLGDGIAVMSCPSAGNCTAAGSYTETQGQADSFVVSQTHGTWGTAIEVKSKIPGFKGPDGDWITAMSCPSAGNCVAGGVDNVERDALASEIFVVSEVKGVWGDAIPVPGSTKLNQGNDAWLNQISCSSAGNCGVAGWYSAEYDFGFVYTQSFVANEVHGTWDTAIEVPGLKTLGIKIGQIDATTAIACAGPNRCSAGGYYRDAKGRDHTFVASQP